jgi:hypothetical protein
MLVQSCAPFSHGDSQRYVIQVETAKNAGHDFLFSWGGTEYIMNGFVRNHQPAASGTSRDTYVCGLFFLTVLGGLRKF